MDQNNENDRSIENLTKINWAHAVNNRAYLEAVLPSDIAMLEADVVLGRIAGSEDGPVIPIMAHPPATTSDISLDGFLNSIAKHNTGIRNPKGIKLDFKSIEAFTAAQEMIASFTKEDVKFPLWLNADILPGPVNATTLPVDADQFLKLSSKHPRAILSIGWTTRYGGDISNGEYTSSHIEAMLEVLKRNGVTQTVTFPVRAGIAAKSLQALVNLLRATQVLRSTITVWSSEGDNVDVQNLRYLMLLIGLDRTYLDVPHELAAELHLPADNNELDSGML